MGKGKKKSAGKKSPTSKAMVVLMGFPGSGKSTFFRELQRRVSSAVLCSSDELGSKEQKKLVERCVRRNETPVVDSCNVHPKERAMWANLFPEQSYVLVWLDTPIETCRERAKARKGHPTLGPEMVDEVLDRFAKGFKAPAEYETRKYAAFHRVQPGGDKRAALEVAEVLQKILN